MDLNAVDIIRNVITDTLKENGVEDTDENRLYFMKAMQAGLKEMGSPENFNDRVENALFGLALAAEIFRLETTLIP